MEEFSVPGVSLGVLSDGEEETAALGVTSASSTRSTSRPDTLFQIGSITKTFTATAIMRLVERGDVDLDASVRTYLPEFRLSDEDVAARATIRQLLTHTGGWLGDYFADFGRGTDALARYVEAIAEQPQLAPLGEVWSYNNSAFNIAGRVIETVTEKPYEDALRELVLDPLGLEEAYFFADEVITYGFAVGHERDEEKKTVLARPWAIGRSVPSRRWADHVRARAAAATHASGSRAGSFSAPSRLQEMTREQVPIGGKLDAVGLAWMLRTVEGVKTIGHGGGTKGQSTALVHRARARVRPRRPHEPHLWRRAERPGGGEGLRGVPRRARAGARGGRARSGPLPRALRGADGRHRARRRRTRGLELRFIPKGGFPTPDTPPPPAPPPATVRFASADELFAVDDLWKGERVRFLRDEDGGIAWLRVGGRVFKPVES